MPAALGARERESRERERERDANATRTRTRANGEAKLYSYLHQRADLKAERERTSRVVWSGGGGWTPRRGSRRTPMSFGFVSAASIRPRDLGA